MLNAANKGDYDQARKLETDRWAEEQQYWQKKAIGGGYVGSWTNLTRGGAIAKIDIQSEETKREPAPKH